MSDDPAAAAASWLARRLTEAVHRRGVGRIAVSGGATAPAVLSALGNLPIPWADVVVWQVDERVAPDGDPNRNAGQLVDLPARLQLMPVTATDLRHAADEYEASLPDRFDVVLETLAARKLDIDQRQANPLAVVDHALAVHRPPHGGVSVSRISVSCGDGVCTAEPG